VHLRPRAHLPPRLLATCPCGDVLFFLLIVLTPQVGLFAPPEELSAAVTIETLYFYALAHQSDFDVCWCKGSGGWEGGWVAGCGLGIGGERFCLHCGATKDLA
jgi:hypothetical protein